MSTTDAAENPSPEATVPPPPPAVARPSNWMDNWFEHWPFNANWPSSMLSRIAEFEPVRVEQFRENGDLVIRAEMPGIDDEADIDVSITGDKLTVSATRERTSETSEEGSFRSEFHYGSFRRTVTVPAGTDAEDVTATYVNGIVEVRVRDDGDAASATKVHVKRA